MKNKEFKIILFTNLGSELDSELFVDLGLELFSDLSVKLGIVLGDLESKLDLEVN